MIRTIHLAVLLSLCSAEEVCHSDEPSLSPGLIQRLSPGHPSILQHLPNDTHVQSNFGTYSGLAAALPLVIINMTNYSGLVSMQTRGASTGGAHVFGDADKDMTLLFEMVEGYLTVLHETLPDGDGERYCPFKNISVVKRCIDMAACILQRVVGTHNFTLHIYTLYEELLARFDDLSWDLIESTLVSERPKRRVSPISTDFFFEVPQAYECDGSYNEDHTTLSSEADDSLVQSNASISTDLVLKAKMGVSATLHSAMRATHTILDSHDANYSAEETVANLHRAWEPACNLLHCDHTNYFDLFGASHSHSLALIESGASAHHMRAQIRSRVKLENRMQQFLGGHGALIATHVYRSEGTQVERQMDDYLSEGRATMRQYVSSYFASLEAEKALRLVNRERFKAFLVNRREANHRQESDDHINEVAADTDLSLDVGTGLNQMMDTASVSENKSGGSLQGSRRRRRRRRRRRDRRRRSRRRRDRRRRFGKFLKSAADWYLDHHPLGDFIRSTLSCFGQAKTMAAIGYAKKFPVPTATSGSAVSFTISASIANSFKQWLSGRAPSGGLHMGIGVVFGFVPGGNPRIPGRPETRVPGVRAGVGVTANVGCSTSSVSCKLGISVGAVSSALLPVLGTCPGSNWDGSLGTTGVSCVQTFGATVTAVCCSFDLVSGSSDCR